MFNERPHSGAASRSAALAAVAVVCLTHTPLGRAADPDNCLLCHQFRGLSRLDPDTGRVHVYYVDPDYTHALQGPHSRLACTDCHPRNEVAVIPHAPVSPVNCTKTCHLPRAGGLPVEYSHANIARMLQESVHSPDTLDDLEFTGGPLLFPEQSQCLYCHDEPMFRGADDILLPLHPIGGGIFDRCESCHTGQLDVDIAYYLRHIAARLQPARPTMELAQVCAVCHSDPSVRKEAGLRDAVASYVQSFHGKAALLGDLRTANCLSCHASGRSIHLVLNQEDPDSTVHPERVADVCSSVECHPGASPGFSDAAVHLDLAAAQGTLEFLVAAAFILLTMLTFGPSAVLAVLELLQSAVGRHHHADESTRALARRVSQHPEGRRRLVRFTPTQRVQHWILAVLFVLLALTGFPMKFADTEWARWLVTGFGGLERARLVHHWSGFLLVVGLALHVAYIAIGVVRRALHMEGVTLSRGVWTSINALPMWITFQDVSTLKHLLAYLFFLRPDRPRFGKFSLKEKFEYLGVFWGTVILGVTGLLLWGEQIASHLFGGRIFTIAAIFHTYEAFLAVIHVGILHVYSVILSPHVFPLSPAMITGRTPVPELAEGHAQFVQQVAEDVNLAASEGAGHE